jgi:peptide/nickel transport system substrate-binding protein
LIGGQINALSQLDPSLVKQVQASPTLALLNATSGGTTCQFMRVGTAPFTDVRVRQAFRLMVDRHQLIESTLLGYGSLGNDLFSPNDPDYNHALPQRQYDPEQAKSLLKQAGQPGLTVQLYTSSAAPAMLSSATLIASQAAKAGVNVQLQTVPASEYYSGPDFKRTGFESTQWGQHTLDSQLSQSFSPTAYWNEPGWSNAQFTNLVAVARRTFDPAKRREYLYEAQKIAWDQGGYIIWGFQNILDAYSTSVHGLVPSDQRDLGYYRFSQVHVD